MGAREPEGEGDGDKDEPPPEVGLKGETTLRRTPALCASGGGSRESGAWVLPALPSDI